MHIIYCEARGEVDMPAATYNMAMADDHSTHAPRSEPLPRSRPTSKDGAAQHHKATDGRGVGALVDLLACLSASPFR